MEGKVRLTIAGIQSGFGQEEKSEVITTADCYTKGEVTYLFYTEYTEEQRQIKNRLTIAPDYVELRKTGNGVSVLTFRKGIAEKCIYQSPAGPMDLVSKTSRIRVRRSDRRLRLELEYSLHMGGAPVSDYRLSVEARAQE